MELKELRKLEEKELRKHVSDLRIELSDQRWKVRQQRLPNVRKIRATRREIAMALTVLKQKQTTDTTSN